MKTAIFMYLTSRIDNSPKCYIGSAICYDCNLLIIRILNLYFLSNFVAKVDNFCDKTIFESLLVALLTYPQPVCYRL